MILLVKFGLTGILNTGVGYLVIFGAMGLFHMAPSLANALGYAVGLVLSFGLNRTWTFQSRNRVSVELGPFLATFVLAYVANLGTLLLALTWGINAYLGQVLAGVVYMAVSFLLYKSWVFRPRDHVRP